MEIYDHIIWARLAERGIMTVMSICIITFLLLIYRNEMRTKPASAQVGPFKIAAAVTLPMTVALIALGYFYVSASHPIYLSKSRPGGQTATTFFFDENGLSEIFTTLARKKDGLDGVQLVRAQAILRLSMKIMEMRQSLNGEKADNILRDNNTSLNQINDSLKD